MFQQSQAKVVLAGGFDTYQVGSPVLAATINHDDFSNWWTSENRRECIEAPNDLPDVRALVETG